MSQRLIMSQESARARTFDKKKPGLHLPNLSSLHTKISSEQEALNLNKLTISTPFSTSPGVTLNSPQRLDTAPNLSRTLTNFNLKKVNPIAYAQIKRAGTQETFITRDIKTPKGEEDSNLIRYKSQRSLLSSAYPMMSPKEKIPVSKFLFESKGSHTETDLENIQYFPLKNDPNRVTQTSMGTRPFTMESTATPSRLSTPYEYESLFKTSLNLKGLKNPRDTLREIERFGPISKPKTANNPTHKMESLSSIASLGSDHSLAGLKNVRNDKIFRLKNDVSAKYKFNFQAEQKRKRILAEKIFTNEEIIRKNKDKIMVCVDEADKERSHFRYCFVTRHVERPHIPRKRFDVEFNMKIFEVQKKLKLHDTYKHFYLLNGKPVFELTQIPKTECVIVISQNIEIFSVDKILANDLARDFYEYGSKQNIEIYSKSHVDSRMMSYLDMQDTMQEKVKEIVNMFDDNQHQVPADQIEELAKLTSSLSGKQFSEAVDRIFSPIEFEIQNNIQTVTEPKEESNIRETPSCELKLVARTGRTDPVFTELDVPSISSKKSEKAENDNNDKDDDEGDEDEEKDKFNSYINAKELMVNNPKIKAYKDIANYYDQSMKNIKFQVGEEDEEVQQNLDEEGESIRTARLGNISSHLDVLLKKLDRPRKKLDYLEIKAAMKKNNQTESSVKRSQELEINDLGDDLFEGKSEDEKVSKRDKNFIEENIKKLSTKKNDIENLFKVNRDLFPHNIPKYLKENRLTRRELHFVYILYKALCEVTSQRHKEYNTEDGIDFHSFRNGIYQVFLQSEELAEKIFYTIDVNFSGFLNWDEFLSAMVKIRAKTMRDKIDLFIKIADEDGNGLLSKEEIFNLAKICLKKFISTEDGFLDDLCNYYTKLIFNSVGISMDEEIPMQAIKEAIIAGNQESDLLAMFCGADI